eukprot:766656-Hanusia_phi.AAC.5
MQEEEGARGPDTSAGCCEGEKRRGDEGADVRTRIAVHQVQGLALSRCRPLSHLLPGRHHHQAIGHERSGRLQVKGRRKRRRLFLWWSRRRRSLQKERANFQAERVLRLIGMAKTKVIDWPNDVRSPDAGAGFLVNSSITLSFIFIFISSSSLPPRPPRPPRPPPSLFLPSLLACSPLSAPALAHSPPPCPPLCLLPPSSLLYSSNPLRQAVYPDIAMPEATLDIKVSPGWKDMGFQSNDPCTDFRSFLLVCAPASAPDPLFLVFLL